MLNIGMKVFFILCIVLILVNLVVFTLYETASEPVTFSSFLDKLDDAPKIELTIDQIENNLKITDDWGKTLNHIRDFINLLSGVLSVIIWLATMLVNLIIIIGYLGYLLGLSSFSAVV